MTTPGANNLPYLVGQFGTPIWGVSGSPLPFTGNYFWVDETNGSDGNTGGPSDPFATLTQALSRCISNNNDVIFLSGTVHVGATLAWNKSKTHLIGLSMGAYSTALISVSSVAATTGSFTPLVNVTGAGCIFQNIGTLSGIAQAAAQVSWAEAGGSNTYIGCNFNQVGNATAAAHAGNRALTIASTNNTFLNCVIGGDGIVRATGTNYTVEMLAGAGSSIFRGCTFSMWSSVAASAQINAATVTCTGYMMFDDCTFINDMGNAGAVASTLPLLISATAGAVFVVAPSTVFLGIAGKVATTGQLVYISSAPPATLGNVASSTT